MIKRQSKDCFQPIGISVWLLCMFVKVFKKCDSLDKNSVSTIILFSTKRHTSFHARLKNITC